MLFADELTAAQPETPWRVIDIDEPLVELAGDLAGAMVVFEQLADDGSARPLREINELCGVYVRRPRPVRFRLVNASPASCVIVAGAASIFPVMKRIRTSLAADLADIEDEDELLEVA